MTDFGTLCAAVWEAPQYLPRFTRRGYAAAFEDYVRCFGPVFGEAIREAGEDPGGLEALADGMLEKLEAAWKAARFWKRSARRMDERQMMVTYLSPMLLAMEEPRGQELAVVLRDRWEARWPGEGYRIATYEKLKKGFRNAIMGIEIPTRKEEPDDTL